MDLFYDCLPFEDKVREHFHRFMGGVHDALTEFRARPNPLELTADRIAGQTRIICFDEFFVSDIADAMILSNLFDALFDRGMTLVATSNTRPDDLYRGGLQRQRFLSAISLIKKHTRVVELGGPLDYRLRVLERADVYQEPTGKIADQKLSECFEAIAPDEGERNLHIEILGRKIEARRAADGVVWFDFPQICDGPRSQNDYIELSRCYQTVVISNVPKLTKELEDQARRFVALVDEFYDRRVKLILSAATALSSLYTGERLQLEFQRTRSRLEEMQSHDYLASPHIP
jgi:cell division protein ZapE